MTYQNARIAAFYFAWKEHYQWQFVMAYIGIGVGGDANDRRQWLARYLTGKLPDGW
jgi:hypothetical protein